MSLKIFRKKKGFTLIELLVVIAIIALLLAILMPSLQKAKDNAKKVICKSNLNQWGKIWAMFLSDNDNRFMKGWHSGFVRETQWMVEIPAYMGEYDHAIWTCPFADNESKCVYDKDGTVSSIVGAGDPMLSVTFKSPWGHITAAQHAGYDTSAGDYGSYGLNAFVYNVPTDTNNEYWKKGTVTGVSSDTVPIFGDAMWCELWPRSSNRPVADINGPVWQSWDLTTAIIDRHNDQKNNWLMFDFSVRNVPIKELWKLNWHRNWIVEEPDWSLYSWIK